MGQASRWKKERNEIKRILQSKGVTFDSNTLQEQLKQYRKKIADDGSILIFARDATTEELQTAFGK